MEAREIVNSLPRRGTTCFAIHSCFSCKTQFAPLSRQSGLEQGATIFPLFRTLVSAHAECWYRPVSGASVPTTQSVPRCAIRVPGSTVTVLLYSTAARSQTTSSL